MDYPFEINLSNTASDGRLRIDARIADAAPAVLRTFGEFASRFERLGHSGALCGPKIPATSSSLELDYSLFRESGSPILSWSYRNVRVDPNAITIALNLLFRFHAECSPIDHILVDWRELNLSALQSGVTFPGRVTDPSYLLVVDEDIGRRFDFRVDFSEPQNARLIRHVDEEMGHWFAAASLGAYGDALFPPPISAIYYSEDPVQFGDDYIVWSIDGVRCNEAAFDGILNNLQRVSRLIAPIRQVTIGA